MAQRKKAEIERQILDQAFRLFAEKGYTDTSVAEIAAAAGVTAGSIYVYFPSKLDLLYALYEPWLDVQLHDLRRAVLRLRSPRTRLKRLFMGLFRDIPATDRNFSNALMQALADAPEGSRKSHGLLPRVEAFTSDLLRDCLPAERQALVADPLLAHLLWMAFDGFVMNYRLRDVRDVETIADRLAGLFLGTEAIESPKAV